MGRRVPPDNTFELEEEVPCEPSRWFSLCPAAPVVPTASSSPGTAPCSSIPRTRGSGPEVLAPGRYKLGTYGRLEDFDVTYSTHKEDDPHQLRRGAADRHAPGDHLPSHRVGDLRAGYGDRAELLRRGRRARVPERGRGVFARHSYTELAEEEREDRGRGRGRRPPPHHRQARGDLEHRDGGDRLRARDRGRAPREARGRAGGGAAEGGNRGRGAQAEAHRCELRRGAGGRARDRIRGAQGGSRTRSGSPRRTRSSKKVQAASFAGSAPRPRREEAGAARQEPTPRRRGPRPRA